MVDLNNPTFNRWKFSLDDSELTKELNLEKREEHRLPEAWSLLFNYIPNSGKGNERVEDIDCLSDSSISTDVDEEEWEDLKVYMKERDLLKVSHNDSKAVNSIGSNTGLQSEDLDKISTDKNETSHSTISENHKITKPQKKVSSKHSRDNYNVFSQVLRGNESYENEESEVENDSVNLLKAAVTREEPDPEEIAELLTASDVSKQDLINLWTELESDNATRLCLCSVMTNHKLRIVFMCQKFLLPWLSDSKTEHLNDVVRQVSALMPKFSESAIKHLIVPLVTNVSGSTSNPFLKNTYLLQDIMSCLKENDWNLLLKELLNSDAKINRRHLSLLKLVIESCGGSVANDANTICSLISLMNSTIDSYSNDRDFGLLFTTVLDSIAKSAHLSPAVIKSLESIADRYKGPMRFKIANSLKKISKL